MSGLPLLVSGGRVGCSTVANLMTPQAEGRCAHHGFVERGGIIPAPFGVIGLSHHTAPAEIRERVALTQDGVVAFLKRAIESGVRECVVLSTCNRTEVYYAGAEAELVTSLIAERAGMPATQLGPYLYDKACVCAACHLFRVSAGLDSAVLGEAEIVAQVKDAWRLAQDLGTSGSSLDHLFQRGLETGKRIRTETDLSRTATSTGTLAVRLAERAGIELTSAKCLVLGAGKIGERVARELNDRGAGEIQVLNRTIEKATTLAEEVNAKFGGLDELEASLVRADVVFATVGAELPILTGELLTRVRTARESRNLVIVDLGLPTNVEPGICREGLQLIPLEEILKEGSENSDRRNSAIPAALDILDQELARFGVSLTERAAAPTIRALVQRGDEIRKRNVGWAKERLPDLSEKELRVVEEMARRMMIGLLETPIQGLKSHLAAQQHREVVERLFELNGGSNNS